MAASVLSEVHVAVGAGVLLRRCAWLRLVEAVSIRCAFAAGSGSCPASAAVGVAIAWYRQTGRPPLPVWPPVATPASEGARACLRTRKVGLLRLLLLWPASRCAAAVCGEPLMRLLLGAVLIAVVSQYGLHQH